MKPDVTGGAHSLIERRAGLRLETDRGLDLQRRLRILGARDERLGKGDALVGAIEREADTVSGQVLGARLRRGREKCHHQPQSERAPGPAPHRSPSRRSGRDLGQSTGRAAGEEWTVSLDSLEAQANTDRAQKHGARDWHPGYGPEAGPGHRGSANGS